jgi:hypothetical protein
MHEKMIALGKLQLASLLQCGKTPSVGERGNQRRFLGHNKTLQANPQWNPMGEGQLLGEDSILEYTVVPRLAGNTKYSSSNLIVDFFYTALNTSVSISEKKHVYCAVRAESVNIIRGLVLSMLSTHLHLHVALTRKTNRRNMRTFQKAMYFPKRDALIINILSLFS